MRSRILPRDRAKALFNCGFANVQPHCGANANIAAFMALMKPGDTVLSLPIKSGGHLSHGLKPNFSGTFYKIVDYDLDPETELLDYDEIRSIARIRSPQVIICGYSAYPRTIDFAEFRSIADECGAYLLADIAPYRRARGLRECIPRPSRMHTWSRRRPTRRCVDPEAG